MNAFQQLVKCPVHRDSNFERISNFRLVKESCLKGLRGTEFYFNTQLFYGSAYQVMVSGVQTMLP